MTEGPVTRGRRFFKLAGMTAQVAGSYAGTRIKSIFQSEEAAESDRKAAHELNGSRIAKTLGELKGAVMKVGQMASIAGDILPRELAEALRGLQREAPPVDYEVIAGQIERARQRPGSEQSNQGPAQELISAHPYQQLRLGNRNQSNDRQQDAASERKR